MGLMHVRKNNMDKGTRDYEKAIKPTQKVILRYKHAHTQHYKQTHTHTFIISHVQPVPSTYVLLSV